MGVGVGTGQTWDGLGFNPELSGVGVGKIKEREIVAGPHPEIKIKQAKRKFVFIEQHPHSPYYSTLDAMHQLYKD